MNINKLSQEENENDSSDSSNESEKSSKKGNKTAGRWSKDEHIRFIEAIKMYGKNWKKVQAFIGTRSGAQIRSHAQKFVNRLQKQVNNKKDKKNDIKS